MKKSELKSLIREVISEVSTKLKLVNGKYIYFVDDKELYKLTPYELVGNQCNITLAKTWKRANVMQGEDVTNILNIEVADTSAWYEVSSAPGDHVFLAYIGT